jgi:hypothetical protein
MKRYPQAIAVIEHLAALSRRWHFYQRAIIYYVSGYSVFVTPLRAAYPEHLERPPALMHAEVARRHLDVDIKEGRVIGIVEDASALDGSPQPLAGSTVPLDNHPFSQNLHVRITPPLLKGRESPLPLSALRLAFGAKPRRAHAG